MWLEKKLLAAHRGGIKTVLIPEENRRDLKEIPDNIKADLSIIPVKWIDEVLSVALVEQPKPLTESEVKELASETAKEKLTGESISTH